jgi:hypothetical protein
LNELVLEERHIIKTNVAGTAASDFAADKDVKFNGVGLMSHLVCYDSTLIDHPHERQTSATDLFNPSKERLESEVVVRLSQLLFSVTLCNYDLSKVSEESKGSVQRNVQTHHLDIFKQIFAPNFETSTGISTMSMESLNCALGVASAKSSPDGVGTDDGHCARMIWEVKHNISTPAVALRQAISEGTNVGWAQLRSGVKWSNIYVPLIGGNGYLIQFAVLVFLKPGFPYSFMLSKVLDLTDPRDRLAAAGHLSMIFTYIAESLPKETPCLKEEFETTQMGYNENLYHLKNQTAFFCCKRDVDDSLLHLFGVMSAMFTDVSCRYNVLFPLCIRQTNKTFDLVFLKLTEYKIGLPACPTLRKNLLDSVKKVLGRIHECGVAHLDLYPSNIMWKEEVEGSKEVHVMIIDWDSAHFVHEFLHEHVSRRLSSHGRAELADKFALAAERSKTLFDYDSSLLQVLESNLDNPSLQVSQKNDLDKAFFALIKSTCN